MIQIIPVEIKEEIEINSNLVDLVLDSSVLNDGDILVFFVPQCSVSGSVSPPSLGRRHSS